ncbi:MFS transporter [Nocardioides nanhaiensis]|uniref:MFS transporter n=1 Tax=Nocardioides nanhaiensis TaxID=1476871 RepID=A0ABP8WCD2_9ACTN
MSSEALPTRTGATAPPDRAALQRRTLATVALSQVLGGAGIAAGITVGALLAEQLLGSGGLAGVPTALFTLGSALSAYLVGRLTQVRGRRLGLGLGFAAGALGAAGVVVAAVLGSVALLLPALFVYGAGTATNLQARYAGTDLALPEERGTAVSTALVFTTLGAVAGPNLVGPLGRLAESVGLPALSGPFVLASVAYGAAGLVIWVRLRPDPFLVARELDAVAEPTAGVGAPELPASGVPDDTLPRGVIVGGTVMVLTQVAMVAIMTMTPVHMRDHGHGLPAVGLVISLHVAAMFLPSLVTGRLVDRVGRVPMAIASGVVLLLAGVTAALAPGDSLAMLVLALVLLGLGWNIGLIAGTTLVVDATHPGNRGRVQGSLDVLVALGGAGGGAASGVVVAGTGFSTLALAGGVLALLLVPVVLWSRQEASARS